MLTDKQTNNDENITSFAEVINTDTHKISKAPLIDLQNRPGALIKCKLSVTKRLSKKFGFEFRFKNNSVSYGVHM